MAGEQQVSKSLIDEWSWSAAANPLPRSADVAIVGGGIVGVSAAYYLARQGVSVALLEKGRIAGEQSGRNWGWVRQQGRSPVELPLMMRSLRLWQELKRELGEDIGFHQGGSLYLAQTPAQLAEFEAFLQIAREHALDTRLLSATELGSILTSAGGRWAGALHTASDARAEPSRAAPAIARAARRAGASIVSNCAVRGLDRAAGRVNAVVTEHGTVTTGTVVCAAGAWTRLFCRSLDITVPQLTVLGTVARLAPTTQLLQGECWCPAVAVRRREDGGYTVAHGGSFRHALTPDSLRFGAKFLPALRASHSSQRLRIGREFLAALAQPSSWPLDAPSPFERDRMLDPAPEAAVLAQIRRALREWFPEIAATAFVETWGGTIEASPDVLPVLSRADALPGLFIATGFSGHGFGIGPGAGKLIADSVTGAADPHELAAFRLSRFFDGSPIRPGPAI